MNVYDELGLKAAEVRKLPGLACIGFIEAIAPAKSSKSGVYSVQEVKLRGSQAGRAATTYLTYRPEWLQPGFNPEDLKTIEGVTDKGGALGEALYAVYRNNIFPKRGTSTLMGLCGSEENFIKFLRKRQTGTDWSMEAVGELIRDFFLNDLGPVDVGYTLRQRRDATEEVDPATGKRIYDLTEYYELDGFFWPHGDALKAVIRRAERAAREAVNGGGPSFRLTFEI